MWKGACAESARGSGRTTGDRLGIHRPHSEFLKMRTQIVFFCCYLRHRVSQCSSDGWPVDKAGPEFTGILQPLPPGCSSQARVERDFLPRPTFIFQLHIVFVMVLPLRLLIAQPPDGTGQISKSPFLSVHSSPWTLQAERTTPFETSSHVEFWLVNSLSLGLILNCGLLPSPSQCWDYRPAQRHLGLCAQALHPLSYRAPQYDLLLGTLGIPRKYSFGQFLLIVMSTF